MKCVHCGYIIPTDSEFCPYCGSKVVPPAPAPMPAPAPAVPDTPKKPREDRDCITQSQRYFDSDYGYSAENPMVVSSVPMVGYYLAAFRTEDGQAFTWERQSHKDGQNVDEYQLFLAGELYRTVFFRTGGNDTEYLPKGITKDADAFKAAQTGITLDEFYAQREAKEEKKEHMKARLKKLFRIALCILVAIALCTGIYFGVVYGYPYLRYQSAVGNLERNPQKSIEIFDDLGNYKQAVALGRWAHYYRMKQLVSEEEYESALQEYDYFNGYLEGTATQDAKAANADATALADTCYQELAAQAMAKEDYTKAVDLLGNVKQAKSISKMRAECYYHLVLQNYEAQNWADATTYLDKLKNVDSTNEFDVSDYRHMILYNYAESCLEEGTEQSCSRGNRTVIQLIEFEGETDELRDLQKRLTDARQLAAYDAAVKRMNSGDYEGACGAFMALGDYKDSQTQMLEAMYRYVHSRTNKALAEESARERMSYEKKAKTLSEANYKDSRQFYHDLTAWSVSTIMNNDPDDDYTALNSVSKYDNICVHISVSGGEQWGSVRLKYVFTFPDGDTVSGKWDWDMHDGAKTAAWCYYDEPQYGSAGTCKVRIYNVDTNELLAEDSIRVTD